MRIVVVACCAWLVAGCGGLTGQVVQLRDPRLASLWADTPRGRVMLLPEETDTAVPFVDRVDPVSKAIEQSKKLSSVRWALVPCSSPPFVDEPRPLAVDRYFDGELSFGLGGRTIVDEHGLVSFVDVRDGPCCTEEAGDVWIRVSYRRRHVGLVATLYLRTPRTNVLAITWLDE